MKNIRVRFAPSPTGPLHIGGLRTALYNYLFAKKNNGTFILRIEDTDKTRYIKGAENHILESLQWSGIEIDEGFGASGSLGPYKQSERKSIYAKYISQLIGSGKAYYAFDTQEELTQYREDAEKQKLTFAYNSETRNQLKNSISLGKEKTSELLLSKTPYVIRFLTPENEIIKIHDMIRGDLSFLSNEVDDKVLFKSDGLPTYHFANIVDDHLMKISHVIRGEEWLPSLPLHVMLYKALGFSDTMPSFAHLPLILKPTGKGKLSKRDAEKSGIPIYGISWFDTESNQEFTGFKESGFLPEACNNFLSLLGWNPKSEQEIFSMPELINAFSIEHVNKAGAKYDFDKAKWINHQFIAHAKPDQLLPYFLDILNDQDIYGHSHKKLVNIISLIQHRCHFLNDLLRESRFFFERPSTYDSKLIKKKWKDNTGSILSDFSKQLQSLENFNVSSIKEFFESFIEKNNLSFSVLMNPLRLVLVGSNSGPDLAEICALLGLEEVIHRIDSGIENIHQILSAS